MSEDDELAAAKDLGWRELREVDRKLAAGEIDEEGWHAAVLALIEPVYLGADTPQGQSGRTGDAAGWEGARRLLLEAIDRDGTFLDIGCANGLLMESVAAWAAEDGWAIEPHGVEISAPLADLARRRCPQWADRIVTANAMKHCPDHRFDYVRTNLDYVPPGRGAAYVTHLLDHVVAPDGRLVIGVFSEERGVDTVQDQVWSWGFDVAGATRRAHAHPALAYKAIWLDGVSRGA